MAVRGLEVGDGLRQVVAQGSGAFMAQEFLERQRRGPVIEHVRDTGPAQIVGREE